MSFNAVKKMTDEKLLQEHKLYKEQLCQTTASGKSSFCLQSLARIEVELDNRNIEHSKFAIYDFGDADHFKKLEEFVTQIKKITIVLQSYDEDAIKEAIEKNHLLDLKNLSEEDVEKTVMLFMETVKDRVKTPNTPQIIFDEQNEYLMRMGRAPIEQDAVKNKIGIAFVDRKGAKIEILPFDAPKEYHHVVIGRSGAGMSVHTEDTGQSYKTIVLDSMEQKPVKSKKQPDYRKFEKNKRY